MPEPTHPGLAGRTLANAFAAWSRGRDNALIGLPWFPFPVAVSANAREAGERIAQRALAAQKLLCDVLGTPPRVSLLVLSRDDWERHADVPSYGVTHVARDGELVVGAEPADAWQTLSDYFAQRLSPDVCAKLIEVHGVDASNGRAPALAALAETLVAHEIGHLAATQAGVAFPRRWLEEAFANCALVAILGETDPAGLRLVGSLAEAAATLDDEMPTLAEFEAHFGHLDVGRSVLAELAITRGAYAAYASQGTQPLARLAAAFRDACRARDADYELGRMLATRVHPAIAAIPASFASPAKPARKRRPRFVL